MRSETYGIEFSLPKKFPSLPLEKWSLCLRCKHKQTQTVVFSTGKLQSNCFKERFDANSSIVFKLIIALIVLIIVVVTWSIHGLLSCRQKAI